MEEIAVKMQHTESVNRNEARKVLDEALRHETALAAARHAYFERACQAFEEQHQLSTDEFLQQFESGALGDDEVYFDWYAVKRGLDLWKRRLYILSGVTV